MTVSKEIGKKLNTFRKARGMTLEALARQVCKSKSTLSKYEKGEISLDVETLYELAQALGVHVEQLLYVPPERTPIRDSAASPAFFKGLSRFYGYIFDGRANQLIRCVFDVLAPSEENGYKIMMYMNFKEYAHYENCENTYWGYIRHFDALTRITLTNQDTPMEQASVQVLASYLDSPTKWGLFTGFSSRPMMPIATKILLSKQVIKEDEEFLKSLKISREDVRILKLYNMLSIT